MSEQSSREDAGMQSAPASSAECGRGRDAAAPREMPPRAWRDVVLRVVRETTDDRVTLLAAGVAFYGLLALFPGLAAFIALYGLIADPEQVSRQLLAFGDLVPAGGLEVIEGQLEELVRSGGGELGLGFVVGLAVSLWSAMKGTRALILACNAVYDEEEGRGYLRLQLLALLLTLGSLLVGGVAVALVVVLPLLLELLPGFTGGWGLALRWPLLAVLFAFSLAVVYRLAPNRSAARWRWLTWGSTVATLLWLAVSAGFSLYASLFGRFGEVYGAVSGVVVLLLWLYLSALAVLLGAEINAELEHQTAIDSTLPPDRPMGEREAHVADTLGEIPDGPWRGDVDGEADSRE